MQMALVVDNSYLLDVFPLLICVSVAHWYLYFAVLDVTLNIRYMLWNMYVMLAERQVVVLLWWSIYVCFQKKKKMDRHILHINSSTIY
jgi:hypothetical protein